MDNLLSLISVPSIKEYLINYILSKPDYLKWKDFYESSTGMLLIELLAILGSYSGYQSLIARRESYMPSVKVRSSGIGIAETLGYPVYRGKNEHLTLTITPTTTIVLDKYSIVGSCTDKDIVNINPINLVYGEEISFEVAIGNLKEENISVDDSSTNVFNFTNPKISEDYTLYLNTVEVPVNREILQLLNDYYIVLSNSLGSVDVLYLNRLEPVRWINNSPYISNYFVMPNFNIRNSTLYSVGDRVIANNGLSYEATNNGTSGEAQPIWNTIVDSLTIDNEITWKCLGEPPSRLYFRNTSPGQSFSGNTEPIWPMVQGSTVIDNEITWVCVRDIYYSLYPYNTGDILKIKYIELSEIVYTESDIDLLYGALLSYKLNSKYTPEESLSSIKINAPLYHETKHIVRSRQDYRKLLKELLPDSIDTNAHDLSPAIVEVTYVKDHTTILWEHKLLILAGTMVLPSIPNGFIYRSINEGYTSSGTSGLSSAIEPVWTTGIGDNVIDNQITWICVEPTIEIDNWQASTMYNINAVIYAGGFKYSISSIHAEPEWTTEIGSYIIDNEVTWECIDTIFILGYDAITWEVSLSITEGSFILPIVPIDYFYIARTSGVTSQTEPSWPTVLGETVMDNEVTWECYDLIEAEKYIRNTVLKKLSSYRVFGVAPAIISDPKIVFVRLNITLYIQKDSFILITQIKKDIDAILYNYERVLEKELGLNDIEEECENLSYVKVARITVAYENKSNTWEAGKIYIKKDIVYPTTPTGLCYECYYIRNSMDEGTSQDDTKSFSGGEEPVWPTVLGELIEDNHIVWECVDLVETPNEWSRNSLYTIGDEVVPTIANGFMYSFLTITSTEPEWPTSLNESVVDHEIYWVARDPTLFFPSCSWNEYYLINRNIEVIQ